MNPLLLAGGVAGVLTLVEYSRPGTLNVTDCKGILGAVQAMPHDTLDQTSKILTDLIASAASGRTSGLFSEAIDADLDTARNELANAGGFNSANADDQFKAATQLASAMASDCALNQATGTFFTSQTSPLDSVKGFLGDVASAATLGIFSPQASDVRGAVGSVAGYLIPSWIWGALVLGGVVVGGYFLLRSGVLS